MGELPARVGELPPGATVVAVCRSGARSAQVTAGLTQQGIDAVNLDGGMQAWAAAGRAMIAERGQPYVA
jgi:rhodanese-related sulfurtransferase